MKEMTVDLFVICTGLLKLTNKRTELLWHDKKGNFRLIYPSTNIQNFLIEAQCYFFNLKIEDLPFTARILTT